MAKIASVLFQLAMENAPCINNCHPGCLVLVIVPLNAIIEQQLKKLDTAAIQLKSECSAIKNEKMKYVFSHPEDTIDNRNFNDYSLQSSLLIEATLFT